MARCASYCALRAGLWFGEPAILASANPEGHYDPHPPPSLAAARRRCHRARAAARRAGAKLASQTDPGHRPGHGGQQHRHRFAYRVRAAVAAAWASAHHRQPGRRGHHDRRCRGRPRGAGRLHAPDQLLGARGDAGDLSECALRHREGFCGCGFVRQFAQRHRGSAREGIKTLGTSPPPRPSPGR